MTNDESLPVMEVDDEGGGGGGSAARTADLHWLARLSCCWRDVERLRHEVAKASNENAHNGGGCGGGGGGPVGRIKLLQTVLAMQQVA